MNITQLLLSPTGRSSESLGHENLNNLIQAELISSADLLALHDGVPLWVKWFDGNRGGSPAADMLVNVLSSNPNFSWEQPFVFDFFQNNVVSTPLAKLLSKTSIDVFRRVLDQLPEETVQRIKTTPMVEPEDKMQYFSVAHLFGKRRLDLAEELLKRGWDTEQRNSKGETLLLACQKWTEAEIVLRYNPDCNAVDNANTTVLDRIKEWASSEYSFADLSKIVQKHRKASAADSKAARLQGMVDGLVALVSSQRIGSLKKDIAILSAEPHHPIIKLHDIANRSLARIVIDTIKNIPTQAHDQSANRFFVRFCQHVLPLDKEGGWVDFSSPLPNLPNWTERDDLLMTLSIRACHVRHFPCDMVNPDLNNTIQKWIDERLPVLMKNFDGWLRQYGQLEGARKMNTGYPYENAQSLLLSSAMGNYHNYSVLPFSRSIPDLLLDNAQGQLMEWLLKPIMGGSEEVMHHKRFQSVECSKGELVFACQWFLRNRHSCTDVSAESMCVRLLQLLNENIRHSSALGLWLHEKQSPHPDIAEVMEHHLPALLQKSPRLYAAFMDDLNENDWSYRKPYCDPSVVSLVEKIVLSRAIDGSCSPAAQKRKM